MAQRHKKRPYVQCGVTSVSGFVGWKGALKKDEQLWPWVLQLLCEDVPCVFLCVCVFFFSVEDVIEGVLSCCFRWGGNEEDL